MNNVFFLCVLCLISGILIIYFLPTKYCDFYPIICLSCLIIVCILLVGLIYYSLDVFLINLPYGGVEQPRNIEELLKKPLIVQVLIYCCFAMEIKYMSCGVLVSVISPFLFVYCMFSDNVFYQNKLGTITFILTVAYTITIFGFVGEYFLIGHFTPFISYSVIFALVVLLSLALFFKDLWKREEQAQNKKMEGQLKSRKLHKK